MQLHPKHLWHVAQIVVAVVTTLAFFTWAPWISAIPITEIPPAMVANFPEGCPAVSISHGNYSCSWNGTVRSNPWGFALYTAIILGGWAFLAITYIKGRGFRFGERN